LNPGTIPSIRKRILSACLGGIMQLCIFRYGQTQVGRRYEHADQQWRRNCKFNGGHRSPVTKKLSKCRYHYALDRAAPLIYRALSIRGIQVTQNQYHSTNGMDQILAN
jgi:hypothetical protein